MDPLHAPSAGVIVRLSRSILDRLLLKEDMQENCVLTQKIANLILIQFQEMFYVSGTQQHESIMISLTFLSIIEPELCVLKGRRKTNIFKALH